MNTPHQSNVLVIALQHRSELQCDQHRGTRDVDQRALHLHVKVTRRSLPRLVRQLRAALHARQWRCGVHVHSSLTVWSQQAL